ncbi:sporulation protein [Metabacillus iocasae]|uniref:Sporulation-control protein n=1 Tax=Priestia iocasae TaxID=2291674 RepID=A0ABS2QXI9_9BACI|nr:sporulation protein [Metabacillus iocasae]MBM7703456.1 sporulation-control protein [Metabacillus iocasae]
MILRKYMSLLGVGSARIDLLLPKTTYKTGETIYGHFDIKGGTVEQHIKRIDCDLVKVNHHTGAEEIIDTTSILTSTYIYPEQCSKLSFTFQLPSVMEPSTKEFSYQFKTKLTFSKGIESKDMDLIRIAK